MKVTKKQPVIKKEDGSYIKNGQSWTDESHDNYQEYQTKYIADNYRTFTFRVRKDTDADLIKYCESQDNFTGLVVPLIKGKMLREGIISGDMFTNHQDAAVRLVVKYFVANERIDFNEYIRPNIKKIPQKSNNYRCDIITADAKSVTLAISYLPAYSIPEIVNEAGRQLESYISERCDKVLVQFGLDPTQPVLRRDYEIVKLDYVPGLVR